MSSKLLKILLICYSMLVSLDAVVRVVKIFELFTSHIYKTRRILSNFIIRDANVENIIL